MKMYSTVSVYLFLIELLNIHKSPVSYKVISTKDKILYGHSFRNVTGSITMDQCFAKCLEDCKCLSFQICKDDKMCQLCNSSNRVQNEISFQQRKGCTSFVFEREKPLKVHQTGMSAQKRCLTDTNCCLTSQPCKNGATCVFTDSNARFTCNCRPGYLGIYCEQPIRSCRGYIKNNIASPNGIYHVIDNENKAFRVYCYFNSNKRTVWTLIHQREYKNERSAFKNDTPVYENDPNNKLYRLSSFRMESIRQNSSIWRIVHRELIGNNKICQDAVRVIIESHEEKCTSCITTKRSTGQETVTETCVTYNSGSEECKARPRNIDEFGLDCCISKPNDTCNSGSVKSIIRLGDNY